MPTATPAPPLAADALAALGSKRGYTLPQYPFVLPPELRAPSHIKHPVVIVGGGLTGLTTACALAQYGVPAVLLDEDNTVGVKGAASRGICYTQKSLEIFQRLGVYQPISAKGIQWSVGRTFAGDDEIYSFDLRAQSGYNLSAQPPFINIQQFYIEAFLVERIAQLGVVDLRWCSRVSAFTQDGECATLTIDTPAGSYQLQADHVIDATGAHSPFRTWCSAGVTAKKGDDRWCIADVRFATSPPVERHTWIEAPFNDNRAVWQHLIGDDVWRIDYQMAPNADAQETSREDVVRARLARQFGADTVVEIVWVGPYAYRSECIDQMRHGRVFFAGDSAKVVSPFGARGGNSGIADADNLAWKLAAVSKGWAAPALLASYHQERHQAARENVLVTSRTARFLRPADGMERLFRQAVIGLAKHYSFARALVNTGRMAVANRYSESDHCTATGGVSVPNVALAWADGSTGVLGDLLVWAQGRLLLLVFGPLSKVECTQLQRLSLHAPLRSVQVLRLAGQHCATEHVQDQSGHLQAATQAKRWALLRPDSYLAATGAQLDGALVTAIATAIAATPAKARA